MHWLTEEGTDVWHADVKGKVTFRIKSAKYKRWIKWLPSCKMTGIVEDILAKAEINLLASKASGSLDWFDQYVSRNLFERKNFLTFSTMSSFCKKCYRFSKG